MSTPRDHGGALDAAVARYGGTRADWLDLSTGINPVAYPLPEIPAGSWTTLPDQGASDRLVAAARQLWQVPDNAPILPTHGASAAIARLPGLGQGKRVAIPGPTYNEHAAAFRAAGWKMVDDGKNVDAKVIVNPNNPDGRYWKAEDADAPLTVIDESFCDIAPDRSLINLAARPGTILLKSFGKFWGLAGLRLGFAIGDETLIDALRDQLGPWSVSGPALEIGTQALSDDGWTTETRARLSIDADRLDRLMTSRGAVLTGGTPLFRLYEVDDASRWHDRLSRAHILTRTFPYTPRWLRLGLPAPDQWSRLEAAL